jgi:hypothetical protein
MSAADAPPREASVFSRAPFCVACAFFLVAGYALGAFGVAPPFSRPLILRDGAPAAHAAGAGAPAAAPTAYASVSFSDWVRRGVAAAAVNFDPASLPAFLNDALPPCSTPSRAARVLILGDSISRLMIDDGCASIGGRQRVWGENFTYQVGSFAATVCETADGAIAYLNLYGSRPQGPYYFDHVNSAADPWADTELRIAHGMDQFAAAFGEPLAVILRTDMWDLHVLMGKPELSRPERDVFFGAVANDTRTALAQIRARAPRALVGTHTVPLVLWPGMAGVFTQYENAIRLAAIDEGLFLFDFNLLSAPFPPESVVRDHHHPTPEFCAAFLQIVYASVHG